MATQPNQALPNGYRLNEYTIVRKIGGGGFSMVYLARDDDNQSVAIKEYLPGALVLRTEGSVIVQANSTENNNIFRHGMKCFFEEGRALARIDHPNVIRVTNFFRANDTVYMVMRFERGKTLQQHIQANRGTIRESFIRRVFAQLLNGLREVHTHKLLHLDIKPSNLYIRLDGSPVLIDFGAARQTLTQEESKLQPMYTPGFAAPEQYHNRERLGPWTDIYSVGASLYACLAGYPAAGGRCAPAQRQAGAGNGELARHLFRPIAGNHRPVPQAQLHGTPAKRVQPAEGADGSQCDDAAAPLAVEQHQAFAEPRIVLK